MTETEAALIQQAKEFRVLTEQLEKQRDEATTKLAAQSADAARLREGIEDAMQRANETRTGSMAFQDTVFAMHAILKAALSAPEGT